MRKLGLPARTSFKTRLVLDNPPILSDKRHHPEGFETTCRVASHVNQLESPLPGRA
jgi:hypothetical protein